MDISIAEHALRLLLAAAAGMAIGLEREWREKAAGLRTITLVSLGAATFMLAAADFSPDASARAIAGLATGVGFLGAGAILRDHGQVQGLTTAAAVWMAAALGVSAGIGEYALTGMGLVAALAVLVLLSFVNPAKFQQDSRTYEVDYRDQQWEPDAQARCLRDAGLTYMLLSVAYEESGVRLTWQAVGLRAQHDRALSLLVSDESVVGFSTS